MLTQKSAGTSHISSIMGGAEPAPVYPAWLRRTRCEDDGQLWTAGAGTPRNLRRVSSQKRGAQDRRSLVVRTAVVNEAPARRLGIGPVGGGTHARRAGAFARCGVLA